MRVTCCVPRVANESVTLETIAASAILIAVGVWRRLVAHTLGVRVVAGSNPAPPTIHNLPLYQGLGAILNS